MKLAEAEMVMEYCADIRRKRRMIERRRAELNDEISSLRGMGFDGMPRGSQPGDSTAAMACRMEELGISEELRSLDREEASLRADEAFILEKLRTLHSVHSEILTKRYIYGFTWEQQRLLRHRDLQPVHPGGDEHGPARRGEQLRGEPLAH